MNAYIALAFQFLPLIIALFLAIPIVVYIVMPALAWLLRWVLER